ncbi:MAG: leucyl aminopeptidase [gamma proteobacterium symbiont of Lucinoma myriamae]|nr:leucyl aminopeptidase [gamma proteobacterium symbiont of Lucinoma myriamae]MCU7817319.1 leucyl aminopeptidase [gamma proteobacterium symbiont of Lucinoma myriamae]MCU7831770.1 leucyl aminopeptidase [gamma proteobacterium symbiont of Lucinoma myriamae]
MEFSVKSGSPEKQRTACVVVGVYEPRRLTPSAQRLDDLTDGYISSLIRRGDLEGKAGQTLLLHNINNTLCDRILLVGCGRERDLSFTQYRKIISNAVSTLNDTGSMEAVFYLTELPVKGCDSSQRIRHAIEAAQNSLYRFDQLKSKKDSTRRPLRKIVLTVPNRRDLADGERAVREGMAISQGIKVAKDLGNMPGNICTPTYLADRAKTLTRVYSNLSVDILDEDQLEELGMNAFLSVSSGSRQPAKMIVMNYQNTDSSAPPICLVGKGVTFDSGGISLKPGSAMDEMKYDMCGAASVIGAVNAIAELQLEINVVAVIPATENLPDGLATKPGDIVTSYSGTTIEILNTDAEGRLILCDALSYCERFNPSVVIDIATLTGACVVALGKHAAGLFSNHSPLAHDLNNAGKSTGDRVWEMPLWEEYQEQLKSNFADLANIGGKEAGSVTAATFLSAFCKKYHWAHLDIAGVAWESGTKKGSTGRPVSLLTQYIIDQVDNS